MIVRDKIYINVDLLGRDITELCALFTYKNPEFYKRKRLKFSTKNLNETLIHYKIETIDGVRTLVLPRGGLKKVLNFFKLKGLPIRIADERLSFPPIDCGLKNTTLEDQQERVIVALIENEGGLIQMPTGAGKTISVLGLIAKLKQPTLIIVHEHRLRSQWELEIKERLGGNFVLGRYDGESHQEGDICTAIINTVSMLQKNDKSILDKFGLVICDETHRVPSDSWLIVMHNSASKYRVGVTATVGRKDGKEILTYDIVGDIILDVSASEVQHRITSFEYQIVNTNLNFTIPQKKRWTGHKQEKVIDNTALINILTEMHARNAIILEHVAQSIEDGYYPIVATDRVAHARFLNEKLISLGYKTVLLIGDTRKNIQWDTVRSDTSIQCIVATNPIISEGLDIPPASALHLTTPSSNHPKLTQRIGRIRRQCDNKPIPKVFDYVDNLAYFIDEEGDKKYFLTYSAKSRLKLYKILQTEYEKN